MCIMGANGNSSVDDERLRLRRIVDSTPALIHTARPDGYLDFFNQTWLDFLRQPLERLLGWEWTSFIHPEDLEVFVQKWRDSITTGERFEGTARVRRADGEYRWMLHHKLAMRDEHRTIIKWYGSSIDIEERKRAEEELRKSALELQRREFYLAEAQRLGHMGGWVFDPAGGFDYWSRELFHIYGLDPTTRAPTTEEYLALIHPQDRVFMASLMKRMLTEVSEFDITKRTVRPKGEVRYIRCVGTPAVDNGTQKLIGTAVDVTEHELLTQELRRREAYLAEAQRLSQTGSFGWRPDSGELVWSDETYRIFEYDPAEKLTLDKIMERVCPEDRHFALEVGKQPSNSSGVVDFKLRLLFPDGRVKYIRVLVRQLGIANDNLEFAGAVIDRTEVQLAEERIRQNDAELRLLIDAIPQQVAVFDCDWNPLFTNRQAQEYTGLSPQEVLSVAAIDSLIHPDDLGRLHRNRERATRENAPVETEARIRGKDGIYRWFLLRAYPLLDSQRRVLRWYATRTDVDERKRAEDHLRDARIKLNKASQIATVAELSASIAHQLNQPLMSIHANAQAARRWLAANPPNLLETHASIDRILRDARAADETMQHIRALFKQEAFDKKEASIPEIMAEAVRLVQEDPNKRGVPIDRDFDENLPKVSVDPIQIQQVFINLISNAIEAMEDSRLTSLVKVRATVIDQNEVLIQVIDNGPGVDDPERIFEPFLTTKEKGMGVGLAVSRSIVEAHSGRIWAENNPGGGATFCVVLPLSFSSPKRIGLSI